ncbi:hypothetical protein [Paenarthrobacter aromaticivorans]|uniref:Uncharacterized protein n=1 Tax=Paenarthrobacter aromaticivorans TaxID=2849150 RepID=A0ABS6I7Y2_9MICC|nr:hypothetical protein [Paenarthrobacter sp. MMS21-TAE1-1]MBU8867830.1 hypothetical protein [Paenarthrobacter sp. MMS21-TAE1-1]
MLNEDITGAPRLTDAHYLDASGTGPERISVEFAIDRQPDPDHYLVDKAATLLHGGTDQVAGIIESLATDRLRSSTGTSARIHEDGYTIAIQAQLPDGSKDPTVPSRHSTARETPTALTPAQAAAVPALERAIDSVLPADQRQHASTLATMVAKEIPSREEVIDAYRQPTLKDVINSYQERYDPEPVVPVLPAALKPYQLSFPQTPATTPSTAPSGATATPATNTSSAHTDASYSR